MKFVEQPLGDGWVARLYWGDDISAGPERVVIEPAREHSDECDSAGREGCHCPSNGAPVGGVSQTLLRAIDFASARADLQGAMKFARNEEHVSQRLRAELAQGVTPNYLALLSREYVDAAQRGQPRINWYLGELAGVAAGTIKGHLWQARKAGLLVGGGAGRVGGQLSPDAEELLRAEGQAPPDVVVEGPPEVISEFDDLAIAAAPPPDDSGA